MLKHTQTIRRQIAATNYLSVFAHFVGLVLKRLMKNKSVADKFVITHQS